MKKHYRYCPICNCKITRFTHMKTHKDIKWNKDEARYQFICYNAPDLKNKEILEDLYLNKKYSLPMISEKYDLDLKSVCFMLKRYNIPLRNVSEALKDKITRARIDEANIKRFGAKNPLSKGTLPYLKRNKTVMDKYGVENVFQILEEFIDEYKGRHTYSKISSLNKRVKTALESLNIDFSTEYRISYIRESDNKKCCKFYDFFVPSKNLLIEVNGDYWHANPKFYKESDVFNFPKSSLTAKEIWQLDEFKKYLANVNKYNIVYIWEFELEKKTQEEVNEIVKNIINRKNKMPSGKI